MIKKNTYFQIIIILGVIGSFISAVALLPQTMKIYKTRDCDSFSYHYLIMRIIGLAFLTIQSFYMGIVNVGLLTGWLVINYAYYYYVKMTNTQNSESQ